LDEGGRLRYDPIEMTELEMRALLRTIIDDIDAGRRAVMGRPTRTLPIGGSVLVAALGLGLGGCSSSKPMTTSPQPTQTATAPDPAPAPTGPIDPGPVAEYMAPEPDPNPAPIDPPAEPIYGVEAPD